MFGIFLIALKEFVSEIIVPNQYQQALMDNQATQLDKANREMAYSNWKTHLKQQTEQQNSSLVSISNLKTDQNARIFYPIILCAFLEIYILFLFSMTT
jgi:CHAT domain-containing protein